MSDISIVERIAKLETKVDLGFERIGKEISTLSQTVEKNTVAINKKVCELDDGIYGDHNQNRGIVGRIEELERNTIQIKGRRSYLLVGAIVALILSNLFLLIDDSGVNLITKILALF